LHQALRESLPVTQLQYNPERRDDQVAEINHKAPGNRSHRKVNFDLTDNQLQIATSRAQYYSVSACEKLGRGDNLTIVAISRWKRV
jgi:hypothetical protein